MSVTKYTIGPYDSYRTQVVADEHGGWVKRADFDAEVERFTAEITRLRGIVPDYAMYPEVALAAVDTEKEAG